MMNATWRASLFFFSSSSSSSSIEEREWLERKKESEIENGCALPAVRLALQCLTCAR